MLNSILTSVGMNHLIENVDPKTSDIKVQADLDLNELSLHI